MGKSIFDNMSIEELKALGVEVEEDTDEVIDEYDVFGVNEDSYEDELENYDYDELETYDYDEHEDILKEYDENENNVGVDENEEVVIQEELSEEEILEQLESDEDLLDPEGTIRSTQEEILSQMEGDVEEVHEETKDLIYDSSGKPVEFQTEGDMYVKEIMLNDIYLPPRTRRAQHSGTDDLESLIIQWGLIEPLHVIPFNGKFLLVHGFRRYHALKNLNFETAICLVDETRPKTTLRFLEVLCNNSKKLDFFEIMEFGEFVERKQNTFQNETIEKIIGMEAGDYLKAKYIRQFDNFGITGEVATGKRSIKDGFKRLERELDKLEKERVEMLNETFNEQGLPESYLEAIEEEANVQTVGEREPLPPHVYNRIKARDKYTCQTCGLGYDQPELVSIYEVHHVIPVKQGGSDADENLILLCANCHKVVSAYIYGEFKVPEDREDMYKNQILLGNIARRGVPQGASAYHFYMEKCDQYWID